MLMLDFLLISLQQHNVHGLSSEPDALWIPHIITSLCSEFSYMFLVHTACIANWMVTLDYLSIWFHQHHVYNS